MLAPGGGGGTPLNKPYRYVPQNRVEFLRRFGLKTDCVSERTTGVYEHFYRFNSKWVRKKEIYANSKWIWIVFVFAA